MAMIKGCYDCKVNYFAEDLIERRCIDCYSRWISNLRGDPRHYAASYCCERCGARRWVRDDIFHDLCADCSRVTKKWNLTLRVCKACKHRFRNSRRHVSFCNDMACSISRRREARMLAARTKGTHTAAEWEELLDFHGGICVYCQEAPATAKDHIVPVSRGGSDSIRNIAPVCKSCNSAKGRKLLSEWLGEKIA